MDQNDCCLYCGARFDDTATTCPACGRRIPGRGGFFKRILGALFKPQRFTVSTSITKTTDGRKIELKAVAGNLKEYRRIEELPPELRQMVESALAGQNETTSAEDAPVHTNIQVNRRYTVRDVSGAHTTYNSLEEMPPELRRIFERHKNT